MKKRIAFLAGILMLSIALSGCGNSAIETSKNEGDEGQSSSQQGSAVVGDNEPNVSSLEDCQLRLIDCHQFEDDGEQFTYLAFALLGPADAGFHLEGGTSEIADAWLTINHMDGGWRVVTCTELPGGVTTEDVSLSVTDHSTSEEKTVLLSDWGEPMSKEELQTVGIYEIEGHLALVGDGYVTTSSDQYGFNVGLGLIGADYGNPKTDFPTLENAAEVFRFYAADGTPLEESIGQEIEEFFMNAGTLKVRFGLKDGADADTENEKLKEKDPYMEYTNADGETFQFPLNLSK